MRLWDPQAGKQVISYNEHRGHATHIVAISDGIFASGGQDGTVKLWDARTPRSLSYILISPDSAPVTNLTSLRTASGEDLLSSAADTTVSILDNKMLKTRNTWKGDHTYSIYSLAALTDGCVLSGGGDGTLALRSGSGALLQKISVDKNAIRGIASNGQGGCVTVTDDGNIHCI